MTPAEIAATRSLIGLTADQLGQELGINPRTIRGWESGKYTPSPEPVAALKALRTEHDAALAPLLAAAEDGIPVHLPRSPKPAGWYLALGARVIGAYPGAMIEWHTWSTKRTVA